jgi:anti-sigma factor RsiW
MSDFCAYRGDREEALVAYLYDDIEPAERKAFESHVATCELCAAELAGLGMARARLEQWAPPEPARGQTPQIFAPPAPPGRAAWYDVPAWMQAVAAVLFLGVAAGAANLHVEYDQDGLSVRTGWLGSADDGLAAPEKPLTAASSAPPSVSQADLDATVEMLREEIGAAAADRDLVRQVRALVAESERKQEVELALRIATLYKDFQTQRVADRGRVEQHLSVLSNNTGRAVQSVQQENQAIKTQVRLLQKP